MKTMWKDISTQERYHSFDDIDQVASMSFQLNQPNYDSLTHHIHYNPTQALELIKFQHFR